MKIKRVGVLIVVMFIAASCKKAFFPQGIATAPNYLVVEGLINLTDSTIITLNHTVNLTATKTNSPELGATLVIESGRGGSYPLTEKGNGKYAAAPLNLSAADTYRLRITTAAHTVYTSDFVTAKVTPAIDSLITRIQPDGIHFSVNAHDPANNSRYYKWDVAETWEFNSFWESEYFYNGSTFVKRAAQIHHCWGNTNVTGSLLTSTVQLSKDIIADRAIDCVPASSEKLHVKFSLLVKQYALTKDAYDYWTKLKSNTEDLGSVFDPQPSSLNGNLHNVNDSAEPVIGYIGAGTIAQMRIFIADADLPGSYRAAYNLATPYTLLTCPIETVLPENYNTLFDPKYPYFVPIDPSHGALPLCVDCTLRGFTTQPAFWK